MIDAEHQRQHDIVAERKAQYDTTPRGRNGRDRLAKKNAGRKAWWALTWHMRRSHRSALRGQAPFLSMTYDEVEAWHARLHER